MRFGNVECKTSIILVTTKVPNIMITCRKYEIEEWDRLTLKMNQNLWRYSVEESATGAQSSNAWRASGGSGSLLLQ